MFATEDHTTFLTSASVGVDHYGNLGREGGKSSTELKDQSIL